MTAASDAPAARIARKVATGAAARETGEANRTWRFHPVRLAAQAAVDAYEHRFGSTTPPFKRPPEEVNLVGPIDEEMMALRAALADSWGV